MLFICSYNPAVSVASSVISSFEDECNKFGIQLDISVESIDCDLLSGASSWKSKMENILRANVGTENRQDLVIVLGLEAMSVYLSMDLTDIPDWPVMFGMVSKNYIELPSSIDDMQTWTPDSHDIADVSKLYNVVGGMFYEYNIGKNIELVKKYFPDVNHIAYLTDNSFGGVSMAAHIREQQKRHPEYAFTPLDGRGLTILGASDTIAKLRPNSALLLGTWRYDMNYRFCLSSSIMMMRQNSPTLPTFTLSDTGLREWAIGGYTPTYQTQAKLLAQCAIDYWATGKSQIHFIDSHYVFNQTSLEQFGIDEDSLPDNSIIFGTQSTLWQEYGQYIRMSIAVISMLIIFCIILFIVLQKTRKAQQKLEMSKNEILKAKERAESSSLLKTSFLADMSHELRTPLNAVVGFSEVMANDKGLTENERKDIADIIAKNSKVLTNLLNGILDITRIESGKANYVLEKCDLIETCNTVISSAKIANPESKLAFSLDTDMEQCHFVTDRQRISQVLNNLISNAVKYTSEGWVRVAIRRLSENEGIEISVADTGRGIPADRAEDVFKRFTKLDEYSSGAGLGLAMCKTIIERFGGRIWVDTSYIGGAKFIFRLPPISHI